MGSSGSGFGRGPASRTTTTSRALWRHYRVLPQRLVIGLPCCSRRLWRHARGRLPGTTSSVLRHWRIVNLRGGVSMAPGDRTRASSGAGSGLTRQSGAGVERRAGRPRSSRSPAGPRASRLHASSQRTSLLECRSARATRVSLARAHRGGSGRAVRDRGHGRRSRDPPVSALVVVTAEAVTRCQTGWSGGGLPGATSSAEAGGRRARKTRSGISDDTFPGVRSLSAC